MSKALEIFQKLENETTKYQKFVVVGSDFDELLKIPDDEIAPLIIENLKTKKFVRFTLIYLSAKLFDLVTIPPEIHADEDKLVKFWLRAYAKSNRKSEIVSI